MKLNMPTQPVHDLVIHPRENDLVVGTHGRGFFITDISPFQELTSGVLKKDVHLFEIEPEVKWVNPGNNEYSYQNFEGESEPLAVIINYYLRKNVDGDVKIEIYKGARIINELEAPKKKGINRVEWDMTAKRERTEEELAEFKKRQERMRFRRPLSEEELKYITTPVWEGEYTVTLTVNGKTYKKKAVILKDYWYDK